MRLSDVVVREATIVNLEARSKEPALREMLTALSTSGAVSASRANDLFDALMRRERLGTTGVGKGVAVPHAKHDSVERLIACIGHSAAGVEFASLDGEPVYTVFLLLASPSATAEHLSALERISSIVRDDDYWRFLRDARSKDEILDIVSEADARFGN